MASLNLTDRFIEGLKTHNLTLDDIKNWKYCGGSSGRHLNYFKICCKDSELPKETNKCVCGHYIEDNCYITNGIQLLVLGNCCIKKFIPQSSRTCDTCNTPHKNRIVNRCNSCRVGVCDGCGKNCNEKYPKCYSCTFNTNNTNAGISTNAVSHCQECGKTCKAPYKKCYNCAFKT